MIADNERLAELVGQLAGSPTIAFDTEADSLHCYFEKLCLIQISAGGGHFLVDPLAAVDLQPLFSTVCQKRLVLHGADYDLRLLRRVGEFEPTDLFDTMIAARLTGQSALGLAALVEQFFGVKLSKASQKANWAIRPLSDQMVEYALNDTRYLLEIAERLEDELRRLGRWDWFTESRDRMIASTREVKERDDNSVWRIPGSAALSPRAQAVLRVLWFWRDSEARAWDRPPFHVIGNEDMLRVADQITKGMPYSTPRMNGRRKKSFEVVVALALQIPEHEWPKVEKVRRKRPPREQVDRFEALKKKRDQVAAELGLDPSILAPRAALEAEAADPNSNALMSWQKSLLAGV
ncbi:MAG: ribonuclease D [Terrimicrobiaceae bacterium]|nr:ribonuclease D [Terrimicrobiaceae bacterium]